MINTIKDGERVSNMVIERDIVEELREAEKIGCFHSEEVGLYKHHSKKDFPFDDENEKNHINNSCHNLDQNTIFKTLSDNLFIGIGIADLKGNLVYVNDYFATVHGYRVKEIKGSHLSIFHNEKQMKAVEKIHASLVENERYGPLEIWHIRKDGTEFPMMMSGVTIKDQNKKPQYIAASGVDITDLKRKEQQLRESEKKFRIITENSADAIFITDNSGNYRYVNTAACKLLGYSYEEMTQKNIVDISKKEKLQDQLKDFQKIMEIGHLSSEIELVKKDGTSIPVDLNAVVLPNGWIYGSCRDISERKRAELKIKKSEEKFRTLFDSSTDAYCIHSIPDLQILEVNKEACKRFGYTKDEFKHLTIDDISITPKFSIKNKEFQQRLENIFKGEVQSWEWLSKTKTGEKIWHLMTLKTFEIDGKTRLLAQAKDITEIKKTQEELRKKIDELQKWKRLTVGRELRMKELKEKIQELENKNESNKTEAMG